MSICLWYLESKYINLENIHLSRLFYKLCYRMESDGQILCEGINNPPTIGWRFCHVSSVTAICFLSCTHNATGQGPSYGSIWLQFWLVIYLSTLTAFIFSYLYLVYRYIIIVFNRLLSITINIYCARAYYYNITQNHIKR